MKQFVIICTLLICGLGFAQELPDKNPVDKNQLESTNKEQSKKGLGDLINKSTADKGKQKKAKIEQYLIITKEQDTTYVDTTLSIKKEYKYNYLRRDNFNLLQFLNIGQTYNTLSYDFESDNLMPKFGARARHFNYMEEEDINYYHVPTPLTELMYKTAFEQGQLLDAFFTVNTSPQFNFSVAYKGLRSLGKYQHQLTSTGNLRFTASYNTKSKRYYINAHAVFQDLTNQENGGIRTTNIPFFESGDNDFRDRGVFEVNFQDAESRLEGKRFYLNHYYNILKADSTRSHQLNVKHVMSLRDKYFSFDQRNANEIFGQAFRTNNLRDRTELENFYNQLQLNYSNKTLGSFQVNASHNNYNYGYDRVVVVNNNAITNRLKGDVFAAGGAYKKSFSDVFAIQAEAGVNVSGDFDGNFIKASAQYNLNDDISVSGRFNHSSKAPNYNVLLNQSDYVNYNWRSNFNNIKTQQLAFQLRSKKYGALSVDASTINDYTYFAIDPDVNLVKPFQSNASITYLRVKLENEIKYKKFALANTILYQNVGDDNSVFNVPEFVTRNTLYYSNYLFKKALFFQTGLTFNYFTAYNMNAYDPVLAEFYVQNDQKIGGFPRFDFFVNFKVRQTRIFFKAEHFNSHWTGYDYYSAPNYPYRDFIVRFGLVWDFFL